MNEVLDFFRKLFDTADWPPRWHCGNWTLFHGWLYIISDLLIWSAYFAMPLFILKYIRRRVNMQFVKLYFLFAAFILACGATHFLDAVTFWFPAYRLNALVRFITGVVSWITVFHIVRLMPAAMMLKTHKEMEKEINERKKAEADLKVSNTLLNEAQNIARIGHWHWDVINNRLTWSPALYAIYGLPADSAINYDEYILRVHANDRAHVQATIEAIFETKEFTHFIHRIVWNDGSVKALQIKGEVITDSNGVITNMKGTAQDITDQQKVEHTLLQKTTELEIKNIELQRFAHIASHDLREPLRKIQTFAHMLHKEAGTTLNESSQVYMNKIINSATRMQKLIDDILHFSSLNKESQTFAHVNLNEIVDQVLSDLEVLVTTTNAVVEVDTLPTIAAVPSQMTQLFQNLISNAVKFRQADKVPHIKIKAAPIKGYELARIYHDEESAFLTPLKRSYWMQEKFLAITVKDNGIGFEQDHAQKIFEVFQRLHSVRAYEGTGIGLAICKRIIENHHGAIKANSQPGYGTMFTIVLPFVQQAQN